MSVKVGDIHKFLLLPYVVSYGNSFLENGSGRKKTYVW